MSPACADFRIAIGAYVLDGLDAAEALAVDRHLAECAACRAEHAELAGVPNLLSRVTIEQLESPAGDGWVGQPLPSESGLRRLLDRARAERLG